MTRGTSALLHAGYWALYVLLVAVILMVARFPEGAGQPLAGLWAAWPILALAIAPNAVAFYAAYGPLFSRFLARRRLIGLVVGAAGVCGVASGLGVLQAYLFFGPHQPIFARVSELVALAVSLAGLASVHVAIALVMRGFVGWYGDIAVKEELTARTHAMELALVRSRLDPHFLFNTLNNIDVLIARDPEAASDYLNKLSAIMRFVLYDAKGDAIALADELTYIERYIALERIRTRSAHYATHDVTGDPAGLSIAPMTFIPFIENAFKHTEGLKGDEAIVSRIAIEGRRIVFECINRCRPSVKATTVRSGLGHDLIRRRLELLYPRRHALEAGVRGGFYAVRLTIETP